MRILVALLILALFTFGCRSGGTTDSDEAPANVSNQAVRPDPEPAKETPQSPPILDAEEWIMDDSIATPPELAKFEILAKVKKNDVTYIIYEKEGRKVQRRIRGLGSMIAVDEQDVP
ncbi:MAG: hypothetical protein AAF604_20635 [Acidobacteriota bacterium]